MKYDFTSIIDRHGMDAEAWDSIGTGQTHAPSAPKDGYDAIPMWVADMNFKTVPTVTEAISERIKHPLFGYYQIPDDYYDSIIDWQSKRNGVKGLTKENIGYENGVLGGVVSAANAICSKGDKILINVPTYCGFMSTLTGNGYKLIYSPLYIDDDGVWRMDYADMEKKLKEEHIHAAVFCSPHNPCGRAWDREEIETVMELFKKYNVYVISDEIWSDIILPGYKHVPTQSVSEDAKMRTVAFYAPSKTFNLAGLIGSYHIIYDPWLNDRVKREGELTHYNDMNVLSMHALVGAYRQEGHEWTDEMVSVIADNVNFACDFIEKRLKGFFVCKPQGTYMLFVSCEQWCRENGKSMNELLLMLWDVGVSVQAGSDFGAEYFIRVNLASPKTRIEEAFKRFEQVVTRS